MRRCRRYGLQAVSPQVIHTHSLIVFTFIAPQGASHGELNQPPPQFQADRPQSVKVSYAHAHIEPLFFVKWHPMTWRAMSLRP